MQRFTQSWRQSLLGGVLVGLWGASPAIGDDARSPASPAWAVQSVAAQFVALLDDDDEDHGDEREGKKGRRDDREEDDQPKNGKGGHDKLHAELAQREARVAELKKRLSQLKDGQDQEAAEIKSALDRVVKELSHLRAELKGGGGDKPSKGKGDREHLKRQIAELKETIAGLIKKGRHDEAEKLERKARDLHAVLEKMSGDHRGASPEALLKDQKRRMAASAERLAAHRDELQAQLAKLEAQAKDLAKAGHRDQAEKIEQTMQKLRDQLKRLSDQRVRVEAVIRHAGGEGEKGDRAQRAKYLRTAAENLQAAGKPDMADVLFREAEGLARGHGEVKKPKRVHVELVHRDREGDKEPLADLAVELKKLRTEVGELREQVNRLQKDRGERRN